VVGGGHAQRCLRGAENGMRRGQTKSFKRPWAFFLAAGQVNNAETFNNCPHVAGGVCKGDMQACSFRSCSGFVIARKGEEGGKAPQRDSVATGGSWRDGLC
jgi:hypothetical protein